MIAAFVLIIGGALGYTYERQTGNVTRFINEVFPPQPTAIKNREKQVFPKPKYEPLPYDVRDLDVLARTLWGEARGQGYAGMQAVANVIMNRVKSKSWPNSAADVCQQRYQFSAWNPSDANLHKMLNVDSSDQNFRAAMEIAEKALIGTLPDITGGADHYLNVAETMRIRRGSLPGWADLNRKTADIGAHTFLRLS
jgi:spore germination cell wall hydrolase CwlJ-like protein